MAVTAGWALAAMKPDAAQFDRDAIVIEARPLASFEKLPTGATRFGQLEWRGGLELTSVSSNFGGWSGLEVSRDGQALLAISDAGTWMSARIVYDGTVLRGLEGAVIGPLRARDGSRLRRNRDRDAEGIALSSGNLRNGEAYISFEQNSRIGRFPIRDGVIMAPKGYLPLPKDMPRDKLNGLEALAILGSGPHKGALIALWEHPETGSDHHAGWMWTRGKVARFSILNRDDYALTGAASLPDGSLVVLERRYRVFDGVRMRIRRIDAADIVPGAVLDGEVLIDADMRYEIDNMEAITTHVAADGAIVLTVLSDDNFNALLQRTLLLQFTLRKAEHVNSTAP